MINHKGFRYGDWASWDPRADILILDENKIKNAAERLSIPTFYDLVYDHEFSHRYFYRDKAIQQLLIFSEYLKNQLTKQRNLKKWKNRSDELRHILNFYFNYFEDIGTVLDVAHVFFLYGKHKVGGKTTESDLKKYSRIILGDKSKRFLDDFEWYSNNIDKWEYVLTLIFSFSLMIKFHEGKITTYKGESGIMFTFNHKYFPTDLLFRLIDVLRSLQETSPAKASTFFERILSVKEYEKQTYTYFLSLMKDLANYDPTLSSFIAFMEQDGYSAFKKSTIYRLQGRKFSETNGLDLMHQGPSLLWTKKKIPSLGTNRVQKKKFPLLLKNFAITHFQECVYEGAELECVLCQIGYCKTEEKNQPWITKLHRQIETANDILYN